MPDKLDVILQRLDAIESMQREQKALLHQHADVLAQLIGLVSSANEAVHAVKDKQVQQESLLRDWAASQVRQDKILESLALRSLEQEGDLRDLKKAR